eukprot:tig00001355_g8342.t1
MALDRSGELVAAAVLAVALAATWQAVSTAVPAPYMDEQFHASQTQRYFKGHFFVWDPMITTFPGLYGFGLAVARAADALLPSWVLGEGADPCDVRVLRATNALFGLACYWLFAALCRELHPTAPAPAPALRALAMSLYPLHFFFLGLYYTDAGAAFFALLCYLLSLRDRHAASALAGAAAIAFRQTNAVWVAFVAAKPGGSLLGELRRALRQAARRPGPVLGPALWQAPALAAFAAFVAWNGAVVVGDRGNHRPGLHLAQLCYGSAALLAALAPLAAPGPLLPALRACLRPRPAAAALLLTPLAYVAVTRFGAPHAFILADNRHFTFYLWRRLLAPAGGLLAAAYAAAALLLWHLLRPGLTPLRAALLLAAGAATVAPSPLLELRYFSVPALLCLAHLPPPPTPRAALPALAAYGAVDAAALALFLLRPFSWPDGSVARFMW